MDKEQLIKKRQEMFKELQQNQRSQCRLEGYIACLNDLIGEEENAGEQSTGVSDTGE